MFVGGATPAVRFYCEETKADVFPTTDFPPRRHTCSCRCPPGHVSTITAIDVRFTTGDTRVWSSPPGLAPFVEP